MQPNHLKSPKQEDEGEWIMSYADTVTLLLCFFVIFFSESSQDFAEEGVDVEQIQAELEKTNEEKMLLLTIIEDEKLKLEKKKKEMSSLKFTLEETLRDQELNDFELIQNQNDISIRLKEKGFFKESSFKVLPQGKMALLKIAQSLKNMKKFSMVHVEGHTDSKPVGASAYYSSNLGLSSLRASNAAEVLVSQGLPKEIVRAVGFGDSKPLALDRTIASDSGAVEYIEENSSQNRRIEIRLLYRIKAKDSVSK